MLARSSPIHAKRRLRRMLGLFFLCLALPLLVLVKMASQQLESEGFYQSRTDAEDLLVLTNQRIQDLFASEDKRPFSDYSFINLAESKLLPQDGLSLSPLAELPPRTQVPGVIGYFQIDPDGSFHSPVLPDASENGAPQYPNHWSSKDLGERLEIKNRLKTLLLSDKGIIQLSSLSTSKKPNLDANAFIFPFNKEQKEGIFISSAFAQSEEGKAVLPSGGYRATEAQSLDYEARSGAASMNESFSQIPVTPKKLKEYNIDQRLWFKGQNADEAQQTPQVQSNSFINSNEPRNRRKEQVVLPEPSKQLERWNDMLKYSMDGAPSRSFKREEAAPSEALAPQKKPDLQTAPSAAARQAGNVPLLAFEGEIDPLQFRILASGTLAFYRKVWRKNQRYIQGFVCEPEEFFSSMVRTAFESSRISTVSSLIIGYNGDVLRQYSARAAEQGKGYLTLLDSQRSSVKPRNTSQEREILLQRAFLAPPLDSLEFIFTAKNIPSGPGAFLVYCLSGCLGIVLLVGIWGLYRLGSGQIELASERSNFVSAVSHELKTPLTSIRMYAEMLRSDWVSSEEKKRSYYDFIFFESERLSRLIANVLHLAKLSHNDTHVELKTYEAGELLDLIRAKVISQVQGGGFQLAVKPAKQAHALHTSVLAEEDSVCRIFINLVDNALKFSAQASNKTIELGMRLSETSQQAIFYVRDYGPGVERAQMKKIFKLFYRGQDELTRTTPGTGIGLALVCELANKLGASVKLLNRDPGAEFQIVFPIQ